MGNCYELRKCFGAYKPKHASVESALNQENCIGETVSAKLTNRCSYLFRHRAVCWRSTVSWHLTGWDHKLGQQPDSRSHVPPRSGTPQRVLLRPLHCLGVSPGSVYIQVSHLGFKTLLYLKEYSYLAILEEYRLLQTMPRNERLLHTSSSTSRSFLRTLSLALIISSFSPLLPTIFSPFLPSAWTINVFPPCRFVPETLEKKALSSPMIEEERVSEDGRSSEVGSSDMSRMSTEPCPV